MKIRKQTSIISYLITQWGKLLFYYFYTVLNVNLNNIKMYVNYFSFVLIKLSMFYCIIINNLTFSILFSKVPHQNLHKFDYPGFCLPRTRHFTIIPVNQESIAFWNLKRRLLCLLVVKKTLNESNIIRTI